MEVTLRISGIKIEMQMGGEKIWVVKKEQSLLAKKGVLFFFQNFRYWFKHSTGQVYLVCSVESPRASGLGLAKLVPFLSTPRLEGVRARALWPFGPQVSWQTQRSPQGSLGQRLASNCPFLFIFPDVWNPFCFVVILHPGQTHFNIGSGPLFVMKSR